MQYLLLIYSNEQEELNMSEDESKAMFADYGKFTQGIIESGHFKGGAPLQPTSTATSVRVRGDKPLTTDGPFAETKEQLGGYYLVECADQSEAEAIAARIPSARSGTIEVRPILEMGGGS